ncbi:MAG: hypothetical protein RXR21_06500 [Nitrososphaeria archaeon]
MIKVADAKLYVNVIRGQKYLYLNYFDPSAGRVKHVYIGSPYVVLKHLERLQKIASYWAMLDPASQKTFLEALSEVEAKLQALKAQLKS